MNKFTKADEGKAAIFIAPNGDTRSVNIHEVGNRWVIIRWPASRYTRAYATVHKSDWANLNLFPAGAMFATI